QLFGRVDLQQHQHAAAVASDDLGRGARAAGKRNQDRRRLLNKIESAGNDIAVVGDRQARRGTGANQHSAYTLQTADGFDFDDGRGDLFDGRVDGLFFLLLQVLSKKRRGEDGQPGDDNSRDERS